MAYLLGLLKTERIKRKCAQHRRLAKIDPKEGIEGRSARKSHSDGEILFFFAASPFLAFISLIGNM